MNTADRSPAVTLNKFGKGIIGNHVFESFAIGVL
jgi:hypothetical protein